MRYAAKFKVKYKIKEVLPILMFGVETPREIWVQKQDLFFISAEGPSLRKAFQACIAQLKASLPVNAVLLEWKQLV